VWLYLIVIPCAPLVLESMGFYRRPFFGPRRETLWVLFKACFLTTIALILFMFLFRLAPARGVIVLFGCISFGLVYLSDEMLRLAYRSRFGQLQLGRRVILLGSPEDTARLREELQQVRHQDLYIVAEFDLNESTITDLVKLLHETSANGVIINAKHTFFGQIEKAIHACEIEGVEAWLVADFFKTQISHTSFDELQGRPVLVFRSAPEASWH
jgi:FlaA1/EpsC-like NDP-sugar epimerase